MANDPYTDDEYDETYKDVHGDEPARDKYAGDDGTADTFFPSGTGGRLSGWGIWPRRSTQSAADAEYGERDSRGAREGISTDDEGGSWWDEGLITLLLVGGLALFLFPEPATSAVGIVLTGIAVFRCTHREHLDESSCSFGVERPMGILRLGDEQFPFLDDVLLVGCLDV